MSGGSDPPGKGGGAGAPAEPSMEDILASIRRILNEDEAAPKSAPAAAAPPAPQAEPRKEDVLVLDSSMMVSDPAEPGRAPAPHGAEEAGSGDRWAPAVREEEAGSEARLMAPEPAAAAAAAVGGLVKRLASERGTLVHHGGPTIEDLVREEIRPLLKAWLDAHLPGLVERLVRAEIERVLGRIAP